MPLDIAILVIRSALSDLEQAHGHARANLCQFDALVSGLDEDVVADLDAVFNILECDDSATKLGRAFPGREEMLQDLDDALAEGCGEALDWRLGTSPSGVAGPSCAGNRHCRARRGRPACRYATKIATCRRWRRSTR